MNKQEFLEQLKIELDVLNNIPNVMPQAIEIVKSQMLNIFHSQIPDDIYINEDPNTIFSELKNSIQQYVNENSNNQQENNSLLSLEEEVNLLNSLNSGSFSF